MSAFKKCTILIYSTETPTMKIFCSNSSTYTISFSLADTYSHPQTFAHKLHCCLICLDKWTTYWDTFRFQTFCEICNRCFTSEIVCAPPPCAVWVHPRTSPLCPRSPRGRFACVWLLTCVRFLRNVGFCSFYPPSVAFPGGIFPDSFSYCFRLFLLLQGIDSYEIYICNKAYIHCSTQCKCLSFHSWDWWGEKEKTSPEVFAKT